MRLLAAAFAFGVFACGSTSTGDGTTAEAGNPCGPNPFSGLPACTHANQGLVCSKEHCACCPASYTCGSGGWVGTPIDNPYCAPDAGPAPDDAAGDDAANDGTALEAMSPEAGDGAPD
jgi:hypothetical protein